MIPNEWDVLPIEAIANVSSGGTPNRKENEYWGGNVPWVTTSEVQFNKIIGTKQKITQLGLKNSSAKLYPAGTILLAMYGQGKTRGQVAILGIEASTNQACAAIQLNKETCIDYYFYFLQSQYENIRNLSNSGGQKNLSGSLVKSLKVPIPPILEQIEIAKIISTWDQAIDTTKQLITNSKAQQKFLMQNLMTGKKRLQGFNDKWLEYRFNKIFDRIKIKNSINNSNVLTISGKDGLVSQKSYFKKIIASDNLEGYTLLQHGDFAYNKSYSNGYPYGAIKPLEKYAAGIVSSLYICFSLINPSKHNHDFFRHFFEGGYFNKEIYSIAQEGARNHGLLKCELY